MIPLLAKWCCRPVAGQERSALLAAIQFKFTDTLVGAAGVLFTIAGENVQDAIYPNFPIQWYWNKTGKAVMR